MLSWLLDVVELVTLHGDVLSKILVSVHAGGEKLVVWEAVDTSDTSGSASGSLEESGGGWDVLGIREHLGRLGAVWGFSDDGAEEACKGKSFHFY